MIVTARQLEELHRDAGRTGRVTLKAGTRLSPLAREWIRKTKVAVEYTNEAGVGAMAEQPTESPRLGPVVWWSDGEHATAKAALMSFAASMNLTALKSSPDTVAAIRNLSDAITSRRASAGLLLLDSAGAATVHANRNPEIRAIVGTTADSVEASVQSISPNVLIIERSDRSFDEIRNVIARFLRGGVA